MKQYTEAQLQAYVERHLERDFTKWLNLPAPMSHVKFLGSQVHCANGIMDILGTVNRKPLIIELKAVPVSEKVVGQVARYRIAVRETFRGLCLDVCMAQAHVDIHDLQREDELMCVVIAPSYDAKSLSSLGHFGWPLIAEMDDAGGFTIFPQSLKRQHGYGEGSPEVYRLLSGSAVEHVGWCIAKTWNANWESAEKKRRDAFHYHIQKG